MRTKTQLLLEQMNQAKMYDLAHPYFIGMPHHPSHPPYLFSLNKLHGDTVMPNGGSYTSEALALGGHLGTHIDALCHFSCGGRLFGGHEVKTSQSYEQGLKQLSIDTVGPIVRRGILLDVAGLQHVESLAPDFEITPEHMEAAASSENVEIGPEDVVLLRTGWGSFFSDSARFAAQMHGPGPSERGAHWLSDKKVFAAGSDTVNFELAPSRTMPAHIHLLVESGIHIIECLNLEQLAAEKVFEFIFIASPLKIQGGTGSPIRPFALKP